MSAINRSKKANSDKKGASYAPVFGISDATIAMYRKTLNDYASSDEKVKERIAYIKSLCRSVIMNELKQHGGTIEK